MNVVWSIKRNKKNREKMKLVNKNEGYWCLYNMKKEFGNNDTFVGIMNIIFDYVGVMYYQPRKKQKRMLRERDI